MPVRPPLARNHTRTARRTMTGLAGPLVPIGPFARIGPLVRIGLVGLVGLLALSACASTPPAPAGVDFVVVRHAEKASDDPRDPSLAEAGRARAQRLAASLARTPLVAAYATPLRRTHETAAPSAAAHGLAVTTYDAATDATALADRLRRAHPRGTVLVVGHSNTVPAIAAALCGCTVAPMNDSQYGRRLTVHVDAAGRATLDERVEP